MRGRQLTDIEGYSFQIMVGGGASGVAKITACASHSPLVRIGSMTGSPHAQFLEQQYGRSNGKC